MGRLAFPQTRASGATKEVICRVDTLDGHSPERGHRAGLPARTRQA